jgi:energy-coupling factor transport system ATP-binding protein
MDQERKHQLGELLGSLVSEGTTVILATHDVELVAEIADRVVLLGDHGILADGEPRQILSKSLTFSTQINRVFGNGFLTVRDVTAATE